MNDDRFQKLEEVINYNFNDKDLLKKALTHKTFAFESHQPLEFNERLEFLGDSVLNFVVAEQLYRSNKYFSEGELTRRRASIVNNEFLADRAQFLGLGDFLFLGKGEVKQNGSSNRTNLANALEALIGAVYLDTGIENVRRFILDHLFPEEFQF